MFKRYLSFAIVAVLILSLTACGSQGENRPSESQNPSGHGESMSPSSETSEDETVAPSPDSSTTQTPAPPPTQEPATTSETFFGSWQIDATITTLPVSSLSVEDLESCLGVILDYEETRFAAGDVVVDSPEYQRSTLLSEQFSNAYRGLTFDDIGITGGEVSAISIENSSDIGNAFFIKDDVTLVVYYEGAFFTAIRLTYVCQ